MWLAIGLTWLVMIGLVLCGAMALRDQFRRRIVAREGVLLQATAAAVRKAEAGNPLLEDDPLYVLLNMDDHSGVMAARLFTPEGELVAWVPTAVSEDVIPPGVLERVLAREPVTRFHSEFDLSDVLLATNLIEWELLSDPLPVLEVFVPLERLSDKSVDGVAWFLLHADGIAAEFARFERHLWLQAGLFLLAGFGITGAALGWAFRRLSSANRLLARRTDDLQRANAELAQSARVAALGAVTAHLMHGLKSPVSGLHSFVKARAESETSGEEAWSEALAATHRMQSLIQQVVRVLNDQDPELSYQVTLAEVGQAVVRRARPLADSREVDLVVEGDPAGFIDNRTASLLTLLLSNLVENGIEATSAGGTVRLRFRSDDTLVCEVIDDGPGLPPEVRRRLFQAQRSTKEGGSGLGLAISRQLAQAIGGSVSLAATGPDGTTFRVELPGAGEPPPAHSGMAGVLVGHE